MYRYIIRRLLQAVPLLLIISALTFGLNHVVPNSPFSAELRSNPDASPEDIRRLEAKYGLDRPIHEQYVSWLWGVVHGDFGRSYFTKRPVMEMILERVPNTLLLGASGFLISLLLGIPLGIITALRRNSPIDHAVRSLAAFLSSFPAFWVGLICLIFFGGYLRWLPLGGVANVGDGSLVDRLRHLILPASIAGLEGIVGFLRIMRSQTLEVLRQDFVRTAYAKGLREAVVMSAHVVRNAFLPVWTGFGGLLAGLVSGAAIFEQLFSWPGVGRLILDSALKKDFPVILASGLLLTTLTVVGYLLVDIGYAWIDPRVRYD